MKKRDEKDDRNITAITWKPVVGNPVLAFVHVR